VDEYLQANRNLWDQWTDKHAVSPFYNLEGFKAGKERLRSIELEEVGDVQGRSLLHLQCHFGMDTLAWARRGATVTGVDFSPNAIDLARTLAQELALPATFVLSDIDHLPDALSGQFDIVFTSYGILHWLRDLKRWGEVIAHFLKPNGIFYIVEDHPFMRVFDSEAQSELRVSNPYFFAEFPEPNESGDYASGGKGERFTYYLWDHSLGEVMGALMGAGLQIEFLHEFPYAARAKFANMEQGEDGWWRLTKQHGMIPFLFSMQARKR
jgi:SAM-dependent methyltransferase